MRCPKCRYISFDDAERCRNCGYEFSLSVDVKALDLPIQTGEEATGPLADLRLSDLDASQTPSPPEASQPSALNLPLFSGPDPEDDRPLVAPPAVPRAPLAVRRGSPASLRPRPRTAAEPDEPVLALDAPDDETPPLRSARRTYDRVLPDDAPAAAQSGEYATASLGGRLLAGAIDAAIILGIDAAIVYFTLQLCGLRLAEIAVLPPVPFLTFIVLLNGGYFATFVAAGGQTIGKMAAGIRVIPHPPGEGIRVAFGYAVLRAAAYLVSVLPAGLGLIPALLSADRRALHDRLAETRVVRC